MVVYANGNCCSGIRCLEFVVGLLSSLRDFGQDYTVADVQGTLEELEQDQICIVRSLQMLTVINARPGSSRGRRRPV